MQADAPQLLIWACITRRPAPIVMIPAAAASWSRNNPTPPLAPSTSSRLPPGRPSRASTRYAVPAASGVAAASANEVPKLIGAAKAASVTASSAYPPAPSGKCVIAMTLSPGARPVTPEPTLSITPATS
jgi:hypothetical protein